MAAGLYLLLRSPQEERWTPAKKWRQMQLLMRQMREARGSHNAQVLALRLRKRELVGRLNSMHTRLAVLDEQLGSTGGAVGFALAVTAKQAHQAIPGGHFWIRPFSKVGPTT